MVMSCCVVGCKTRSGKKDVAFSFHRFPKDPAARKKWILAIKREQFDPGLHNVICSKHFKPEDYYPTFASGLKKLRENVVPSVFDFPHQLQKILNEEMSDSPSECEQEEKEENVPSTRSPQEKETFVYLCEPAQVCLSHITTQEMQRDEESASRLLELTPQNGDLIAKFYRMANSLSRARKNLKNIKARNVRLKQKLVRVVNKLTEARKSLRSVKARNLRLKNRLVPMIAIIRQLKQKKNFIILRKRATFRDEYSKRVEVS